MKAAAAATEAEASAVAAAVAAAAAAATDSEKKSLRSGKPERRFFVQFYFHFIPKGIAIIEG